MSFTQTIADLLDLRTILICTAVFSLIIWLLRRPSNLPPGPMSWPYIGSIPGLAVEYYSAGKPDPHTLLAHMSNEYGKLFSIHIGSQLVVIANDHATVREAGQTTGRPKQFAKSHHGGGEGVAISTGEPWIQQRRFTLSTLRSFGVGKRSFEEQISVETDYLLKAFEEKKGKSFDPKFLFLNSVSNVLCSVVFGNRYEYTDADFKYIMDLLDQQTKIVGAGGAEIFFPIMKYLPQSKMKKVDMPKITADFTGFLRAIVNEHQKVYDSQSLHDYIDVYLKEMELSRDVTSHLNELNLMTTLAQLFFAGTDTSATTLRWAMLFMMDHPEVQEKVQSEIDGVVGRDRLPKLDDRELLPYVDAVIYEVFRMHPPVPLSVPHGATEDTVLNGYHVPQGSIIMPNIWACHYDLQVWGDPQTFRPDRFLDGEGRLTKDTENVIPFGLGRRQCIGEQLARKEIFIFFSHLMHRFTFQRSDDKPFDYFGMAGITHSPSPFEMRAVIRE